MINMMKQTIISSGIEIITVVILFAFGEQIVVGTSWQSVAAMLQIPNASKVDVLFIVMSIWQMILYGVMLISASVTHTSPRAVWTAVGSVVGSYVFVMAISVVYCQYIPGYDYSMMGVAISPFAFASWIIGDQNILLLFEACIFILLNIALNAAARITV